MNKRRRIAVADALRRTRTRLNDNGRHWIKHDSRGKNLHGENAWCALGGIVAETRSGSAIRHATIIALGRTINPGQMRAWEASGTYGERELASLAARLITRFNDGQFTTWASIEGQLKWAERTVLEGARDGQT